MKKCIKLLLASTLLVSCTENSEIPENIMEKEIYLTTGIASRAPQLDNTGAGNFQNGDLILLTANGSISNKWFESDYVLNSSQLKWGDLGISDNEDIVFTACYPAPESTNEGSFEFNALNSTTTDLLVSDAVKVKFGEKQINLTFKHVMHRLKITYSSSDGNYSEQELQNIQTECKALTTCNVDLKNHIINTNTSSKTSTYGKKQGSAVDFIIVPQKADDVNISITLRNGITYNKKLSELCKFNSSEELESGKELNIKLDIKSTTDGDKIDIIMNTINGWGQQGSLEGDIIL